MKFPAFICTCDSYGRITEDRVIDEEEGNIYCEQAKDYSKPATRTQKASQSPLRLIQTRDC